jgi:hypothetical protein
MAFVIQKKFANIFAKKLESLDFLVLNFFLVSKDAKNQGFKLNHF